MRIIVNIPKDCAETEIVINIGGESKEVTVNPLPELDEIDELTDEENEVLNVQSRYLAQNMTGDVEVYDDTQIDDDFGGDIEVG